MTPRHPPRALTGLTTPIGAPPPGKEGGVELGGPRFGPVPDGGVSRRGGRPGAVFRISLDLEGFLLLLFLRSQRPEGRRERETVVWSMPLTRHPFRRAPRGENSRADVRGWAPRRLLLAEKPRRALAYLSQRPNCQKAPVFRPEGGVVPKTRTATPPARKAEGSKSWNERSFGTGLRETGTGVGPEGPRPGVTDPGHNKKMSAKTLLERPAEGDGAAASTWRTASDLERIARRRPGGAGKVFDPSHENGFPGLPRKEVIQPQVPLRLPCYDLVPITGFIFGACLAAPTTSDAPRFGGLTGGVYKAQEHIHRGNADPRLLAIPASCGRVAARNPN